MPVNQGNKRIWAINTHPVGQIWFMGRRGQRFDSPMCVYAHTIVSAGRIVEVRKKEMLELVSVILVILWIFGLVTSYTMGGFIHILLVIAVVLVLLRLIRGRRL